MASINFNPFGENWFKKPPNPFPQIKLLSLVQNLNPLKPQNKPLKFASISTQNLENPPNNENPDEKKPGFYRQMLDQFYWEVENNPDYRHAPEVEKILNEHPVFDIKENQTPEEIEENERWWKQFWSNPVVEFLTRAEQIADKLNEMELKANDAPYRSEDKKYWKDVPHVIGLDGRPMPRKAIKTKRESDDKFWDFARQFFFGLWGFRQRPYPPGRPIDVAQAIGYKRLEKRYYDFIMRSGGFYYKDRLGRTRGPMELIQLKTAWGAGIIDRHTFIWGEDMNEWVPIGMLYGMERAIATWEVRLGASATAFLHKLQKGIPPWMPLKGFEKKSYKQLQEEAYESRRRDLAVLQANDGIWPGVKIPSHCLFLWASGSELTSILEADHMPNKYIPKDLRLQLAKAIPGLRPWEVLSIEQAMDQITYDGEWYREPLGSFTTGPPHIRQYNLEVQQFFTNFMNFNEATMSKLCERVPGLSKVLDRLEAEQEAMSERLLKRREAQKRLEKEKAIRKRYPDAP